ncbi:eukaryotic translation initiation factor 3 [Mycena galericulata]|nr:eukaryotic translation initiation factor 3 [Mycena galericulata]
MSGGSPAVTQIKINAKGDLLFSCSKDLVISVWYSHNGERLGIYDGNNGTVDRRRRLYIPLYHPIPESRFLVSGSADNTLRLWSVATGECLYTWEFPTADDTKVVCITEQRMGHQCTIRARTKAMSQNLRDLQTNIITTGHETGRVALFNVKTSEEIENNERAHSDVTDLQLSKDRTYCVTSSKDKIARIHDTKTLMVIKTYTTETPLNSAALAPTRPYVLLRSGQEAMNVTISSLRQGKFGTRFWHKVYEEEVGRVKGHFGFVRVHRFDDPYFKVQPYGAVDIED